MRIHASLMLVLATTLLLGGCLQRLSDPYESCAVTADCRRATDRCLSVIFGASSGNICSSSCFSRADCPSDWMGVAGDCRDIGSGGRNCYQACATSSDCNAGFVCADPDGGGRICLPGSSGPILRAPYESCSVTADCANTADRCLQVVIPGMSTGNICSSPCSTSSQCPLDWMGASGDCVDLGGTGEGNCYQACRTNSDCNGGFRCIDPDGSGFRLCLP